MLSFLPAVPEDAPADRQIGARKVRMVTTHEPKADMP